MATPLSSNKPGARKVRVAARSYDYADWQTMPEDEKERLNTLDRLLKKISPGQAMTISHDLGLGRQANAADMWVWIQKPGNLHRAKVWLNKWFNSRRSI